MIRDHTSLQNYITLHFVSLRFVMPCSSLSMPLCVCIWKTIEREAFFIIHELPEKGKYDRK